MKTLLVILLAAPAVYAKAPQEIWARLQQPGPVIHVTAKSPTPFMIGYRADIKECALLVNDAQPTASDLERLVSVVHEVGHCHQLQRGMQTIENGSTRFGESFSDVYALAWISKYEPALLEQAMTYLLSHRAVDRRIDPAYNTLMAIKQAMLRLPTKRDPLEFTLEFFK